MLILSFYDFRYIIKTMHNNMQMILSKAMYVIGPEDLTLNDNIKWSPAKMQTLFGRVLFLYIYIFF